MFDPRHRRRHRTRRQRLTQKNNHHRFNWFLSLMAIIFWTMWLFMLFYVEPDLVKDLGIPGLYGPFFLILMGVLLTTIQLIWNNYKRSLVLSAGICLYLVLRMWQLTNWFNTLALILLVGVIEYFWISQFKFFTSENPTKKPSLG